MPTEPGEPIEPTETDEATEPTGSREADPADSAEQRAELTPQEDDPLTGIDPASANEADASEQTRVVPLDEDDYR
ncbi:hypothetical protein AB0M87_03285 [Streptomyces sp. NPDC051320]|uniref:hypothetical protein n=1 Tax=Streptomyces sp. NPDC051320 TaxID=3154644 RepID=UPI00343D1962